MKQMAAYIEVEGRDPAMIRTTARDISHVVEQVNQHCPPSTYLMAIFELTPYQHPDLVWFRFSGFEEYYWNRLHELYDHMISFSTVEQGLLNPPKQHLNGTAVALAAVVAVITPLAMLFLVMNG